MVYKELWIYCRIQSTHLSLSLPFKMAGSASTKEEANPPKVLEQDLAGKNAVVT